MIKKGIKRYSWPYRIYRRMRFTCRLNAQRKQKMRELSKAEKQEKKTARRKGREFISYEKNKRKLKTRILNEEMSRHEIETRSAIETGRKEALGQIRRMNREEQHKRKAEKSLRRKKMRRLARLVAILQYRKAMSSINNLSSLSPKEIYRRCCEKKGHYRDLLVILLNSTSIFVAGYLSFFLVSQVSTMIAGSFYDYPSVLYYDQVYFQVSAERWYQDSVKTVFSAGPVISIVLGITFIILFNRLKEERKMIRLFLLWGFIHSIAILFGGLIIGNFIDSGIGHAIAWSYINDTGKVLLSVFSLFVIGLTGFLSAKAFVFTANSYFNTIDVHNRNSFLFVQVLLPFLLGSLIIFLVRKPAVMIYETLSLLTIVFAIIPLAGKVYNLPEMFFDEEEKGIRPAWLWIGTVIVMILFYRVGLASGIGLAR